MKKFFYSILTIMMAVMTSMTLASCSSDDDDSDEPAAASKSVAYLKCPDNHHPHMIDLGLPSGTKWACCNVGANTPEAYGGYYAWGETEEKSKYDWSTYIHCDGTQETCHDLGGDISGTQYDVAHVKWGGKWQMPTRVQMKELRNKCTFEWTTLNGIDGIMLTGSSGGSIFVPAAGANYGKGHADKSCFYFWSSTIDSNGKVGSGASAGRLKYSSTYGQWDYGPRCNGFSVRAVVNP